MTNEQAIKTVKILHTAIWIFFNFVIFYMLYAVITNQLDHWLWIGYGFVLLEGVVLLIFKWTCPLTLIARKYSTSTNDNFDIYLPNWLARDTKLIYTTLFGFVVLITLFRLFQ